MRKMRLFTPGPTMVPEEVMLEMARPMEHHRTAGFRQLTAEVAELLKYLFQTNATCLTLAGSGTAGMEGAIVSACPPDKKALCVVAGKFGERWAEVCKAFDIDHVVYEVEWGHGPKVEKIQEYLDKDPSIATVIAVASETSTAARADVKAIAAITRKRDVLFIVDGITAVGAVPLKMDEWGIDIVGTGSQKALMLPPGLAFVAVNDRAWKRIDAASSKSYYNCLKAYRKSLAGNESPYTPAVSLMKGARLTLEMIKKQGLENIWAETSLMAEATRQAANAIGLRLYAADPVDSVTAIWVPQGVDEAALRKTMREKHGFQVAGGQGATKGKIIRYSHMGYVDMFDTLAAIASLELTLESMGQTVELGKGVAAALSVFSKAGS